MIKLSEQELHNLAMNIVGKDLERQGYEFIAINSKLKKNPQFVVIKDKKFSFVVVRAVTYPENPEDYDVIFMEALKTHASEFEAKTYYAVIGLDNPKDYTLPVYKEQDFVVNYKGLQEI